MCFLPPQKRVISAASAVSRDFIVELISHSAVYKQKMPAQICQVSSLLHDTNLSVPSLPFPLSHVSRPSSHSLPVLCQSTSPRAAFLCTSFIQCHPASPAVPWRGALAGGPTHQHVLPEALRGRKSSQRTHQAAPHPLGSKRCVRLPVAYIYIEYFHTLKNVPCQGLVF